MFCLAADVAGASSDCDTIRAALNDKRAESEYDVAVDAKLMVIESYLDRLNDGGGLGSVAGGKVIDKKTLRNVFVAMNVTLIFVLRPVSIAAGTDSCSLDAGQVQVVKGMLLDRNSSCVYNETIESVLRL